MATKKTNNKKEETTKKVSVPKKSAEKEKMSKKQASTSKKKIVSPVKKTERKSSVKKSAGNSLSKNSKSSTDKKTYRTNTIRKIEPIKTEDIEKPERESIKLLREAIKAKSKTVSKPVAVKKHLIVKDENIEDKKEENTKEDNENETVSSSIIKNDTENLNKVDFGINKFEKKEEISENNLTEKTEEKKSEAQTFTKNTYNRRDIFKKTVIKNPIEEEELRKNIEKSKFNQSEIDEAIENAAMIEEDTPVEDYSVYSSKKLEELKRKNIQIIETEDEMKSGGIPEIEKKPAEPYIAPPHSTIKKEKKSNKIVAIIGIIIIILGLSYLGFQCFGNRDESLEDGFYNLETNEIETNDIISPITNDANNEEIDNITNEINSTNDINAVIEQTNISNENTADTNLQTNNVSTVATNNAININTNNTISQADTNIAIPQPNLPNPPVITTPLPNPTQNSNQNRTSYLGGNTYRTKWTDTLTSIASSELGDARRWPTIYVMNENIFRDPDSLVFNRDIRIPENKKKIEDMTTEEKRALYDDYMRVAQVYLNIGKTNSANTLRNRARLIVR